jgi:hypothetical protein
LAFFLSKVNVNRFKLNRLPKNQKCWITEFCDLAYRIPVGGRIARSFQLC